MIELRDVSKTVMSGAEPLTILHPLRLSVSRGQFLAILGPSGSGKSTLLGLIAGLDAPTSGQVVIDGVDITRLGEDALARLRGEKIGFVFQFFHLIPSLTAYENVAVPMEIAGAPDPRTRAERLLEEVGLTGRAHHYPSQLSGGEQQRVAGRFKQALPFYQKAEKLYGTIGDRVSYAYTLWSIGTTCKMLDQYTQAWSAFQKADILFKKTGDTRGRIYTLLGFAEVEFLKAAFLKSPRPLRERARVRGIVWWKQAKQIADRSKFAWEKLHVESLKGGRVNLLASLYKQAGSKFYPKSIPVNWP